ncbi:MAG: hypothetical protein AAFZ92_08840 [Pseudomonadota bacterium]
MKYLVSIFFLSVVVSCASTTGPVVIRDSSPSLKDSTRTTDGNAVAVAQPVIPAKQSPQPPLLESIIQQANEVLALGDTNKSIALAEKGLRIDRKQPRLYLVLAKAYLEKNNQQQSRFFAQQGLRYRSVDKMIESELRQLARQ